MPNEIKIALFWLAVWCATRLLQRKPNSVLSRLAFIWYGPFPTVGETRSDFYVRQMRYAFGWLVQLLTVSAALATAVWLIPAVMKAETFLIVGMFFLVVGLGMALLGTLLAGGVALKARVIGPDPQFTLLTPVDLAYDDEDGNEDDEDCEHKKSD